MAAALKANPSDFFEIKSAALTLVAVMIRTADLVALSQALSERFADGGSPFDQDPVAIDLAALRDADAELDFGALKALLRSHRMVPIAVRGGSPGQMTAAFAAGLVEAQSQSSTSSQAPTLALHVELPQAPADAAPSAPSAMQAAAAPGLAPRRSAMVIDKPLRSGQQVYAKDADLIVLAVVSFGAEVVADGNIHVYAPLRGRALAGAHGDTTARIFTTCLEPQLVSIAGTYRTSEKELPANVLGKPAQIWLDGDSLVIEPLSG